MTYVYAAYDERARPLYVGVAQDWAGRWRQHIGEPFYPLVRRLDIEYYPTRDEALDREADLIKRLRPRFNIAGIQATAWVERRKDGSPIRTPPPPTRRHRPPAATGALLLKRRDVAALLGLHADRISELVHGGHLTEVRHGPRTLRYHRAEVEQLAENLVLLRSLRSRYHLGHE